MQKFVDFYFDVGSPASYLAWTQLPALCRQTNTNLVYKPMLLGGVFQATGNTSPASIPPKGRYMNHDLARFARRYGVSLGTNPHFPINTLQLMRAITGMQLRDPARFDALLDTVFKAIWIDALNLNDPAVVARALVAGGFVPADIFALVNDPEIKTLLKTTTEEAVQRGVFGAPTMFVRTEMFFGQDRLDFVREALA